MSFPVARKGRVRGRGVDGVVNSGGAGQSFTEGRQGVRAAGAVLLLCTTH